MDSVKMLSEFYLLCSTIIRLEIKYRKAVTSSHITKTFAHQKTFQSTFQKTHSSDTDILRH